MGGILRDVFTMGARPIAVLDSLRFGDLDSGRVRYLFSGVVKGVGDYGNCVGIPNIGGEAFFDRGYEGNPIVNAMCLASWTPRISSRVRRKESETRSWQWVHVPDETESMERPSLLRNSATTPRPVGRRSRWATPLPRSYCWRPAWSSSRAAISRASQDMGAAGITSSASEMAGRSGNGVEIDMELVPVREPGMTPYEILLSESQERMLVVARSGSENGVRDILTKWELEAEEIGRVTDDGLFRVREGHQVVAEIPSLPLTEGCPTYERDGVESEEIRDLRCADLSRFSESDADPSEAFLKLMASPNIASKRWIYRQYDTTVRTGTAVRPGGDAGVVRLRGSRRAVAATTDCNGRYVYLNPRSGAMAAVAEAARNLVCVGALPTAVTNNLNFGNPLKPHIYYQFREAVLGMAEACKLFETPVTGGNVSFYNETDGVAIYPTPVIGMVGVLEDVDHITRHAVQNLGDTIILLGDNTDELGASEYLYVVEDLVAGEPPSVDLLGERGLQHAVLAMVQQGLLHSAHDVSEGGLACALAESALGEEENPLGVHVTLHDALPALPLLFGEAQGRVVASCDTNSVDEALRLAKRHGVPCRAVGKVVSSDEGFRIDGRVTSLEVDIETLADLFFGTIPKLMDGAGPS